MRNRNWTVLFIGGTSGTGKSRLAYELAEYYRTSVLEVDDIVQSLEAMTTIETLPAVHYWSTGKNWLDVGVSENVDWLISVGKEISPALKALTDRHIEDKLPAIIEGDFIQPDLVASLLSPEVKALFIFEQDKEQIIQNYLVREGGEPQQYRAEISVSYGQWLSNVCADYKVNVVESRPWDTLLERVIDVIDM